jgi:chemotaxis protein MotB
MAAAAEEQEREDEVPFSPPPLRKKMKAEKGEGLWLMSFSDMSLILMSFFVLQLSYSTPDKRKYENVAESIAESKSDKPKQNLKSIEKSLSAVIKDKKLDKVAEVKSNVNGLAIELKDQILFDSGAATVSDRNAKTLESVMQIIAKTPGTYKIVIEGHTDDVPVKKGPYASNWGLSAARGISLLESFKARGVPEERISVVALAQTRPKVDIAGRKGEELKKARAANRRVVIRIE